MMEAEWELVPEIDGKDIKVLEQPKEVRVDVKDDNKERGDGMDDRSTTSIDSNWSTVDSNWSRIDDEVSSTTGDYNIDARTEALQLQRKLKHALLQAQSANAERDVAVKRAEKYREQLRSSISRIIDAERKRTQATATILRLQLQNTRMKNRIQSLELRASISTSRPFPTRRAALMRRLKARKREGGKNRITNTGMRPEQQRRKANNPRKSGQYQKTARKC
mmetsp:Transcript_27757/g.38604  ORF Transcript_27757/g.38604 Transcript_27757/m.38604 type:complete len:221 (-) Transcript_27757:206-868(-)